MGSVLEVLDRDAASPKARRTLNRWANINPDLADFDDLGHLGAEVAGKSGLPSQDLTAPHRAQSPAGSSSGKRRGPGHLMLTLPAGASM